jgi:hypothetical protein
MFITVEKSPKKSDKQKILLTLKWIKLNIFSYFLRSAVIDSFFNFFSSLKSAYNFSFLSLVGILLN